MAKVAIAWVSAQGQDVVPLVGARRRERVDAVRHLCVLRSCGPQQVHDLTGCHGVWLPLSVRDLGEQFCEPLLDPVRAA